jgi:PAS domain S-box-containing protein/putative nucleotidyltransferase with HDIG domain
MNAMSQIRILVVEDESLVGQDINNMLRGLGYDVVDVVSRGDEAVRIAESASPDLVLMDIVLKGEIDGIQAAERIWEECGVPIIYLTAYADEATLARAKMTEPFGYILKPFDERELQTAIEMAFYKARIYSRLREREDWLSTILRSIGDGVIATDLAGRIEFLNPPAERLTGWTQEEALHRPAGEVLSLIEDPEAGSVGRPGPVRESVLRTKTGKTMPVETTASPLRPGKRDGMGSVFVFRDISERRRADAEIKESHDRLEKALSGTVQAMSMTIELRDPYTAGHQRRVGRLSEAIAREMGLPFTQVEGVRMSGDIHDIGKIYVPAEILSKPGHITEIEYSIIKNHAQAGYEILRTIDFPWPVAEIVHQHHERLDGSGYPAGLTGDRILLEAKILSVADVVEAMSSHRPYRPSFGIDAALDEVVKNRGRLYDPGVVDACLTLFRRKNFSFGS